MSQGRSADEPPLEAYAHPSLDAWGLGVTLYELFSGGAPLFPHAGMESATETAHLQALFKQMQT